MRFIDVDEKFAMIPSKLKRKITQDIADGFTPAFVCATVGTTNTTAMDPIEEIGRICKEYNIWLHVDAAMAALQPYALSLDICRMVWAMQIVILLTRINGCSQF